MLPADRMLREILAINLYNGSTENKTPWMTLSEEDRQTYRDKAEQIAVAAFATAYDINLQGSGGKT